MASNNALTFDHLGLFKKMSAESTTQDYRSKEAIFEQGAKADSIYYIQHGNVKLTVASTTGKKAVIAFLRHGDFFGEGCMSSDSLRNCTAIAIEPCTISRVKRSTLIRIVHEDPKFAKLFISYLLFRIARIQHEFVDQIFSSSEKRLARILLTMAGLGVATESAPVLLKVSQQTLAEMVGTTRSRVSYFMNRFREMGLIDYNGTLQVHVALRTFLLQK